MKYLRVPFMHLLIVFFLGTWMTSCSGMRPENAGSPVNPALERDNEVVDIGYLGSGLNCVTLLAGQTNNAGTVCFDDIDTDNDYVIDTLEVTYTTSNGWELVNANLWIGGALSGLPQTPSGNPIPGQFPYKSGDITGSTSYIFLIPLADLGFECPGPEDFYVAANASVRKLTPSGYQNDGAWGDGIRLQQRGNWAMYFIIYITCDDLTPPAVSCDTAFGYGGDQDDCFQNFDEFIGNPSRWGWTNGPLSQGSYVLDLYAGAAKCDLSKGTLVGNVQVDYVGVDVTVTYNTSGTDPDTGEPYTLEEVHLFVGNERFPRNNQGDFTIAPGQYPYKAEDLNGVTTYTFNLTGFEGDIYVIAHAVVCGFPIE